MVVNIIPGNLRDISYVAANMRSADREEVFATARLESATQAAAISFHGSPGWSWMALYNGQPAAAFGIGSGAHLQPHIRHAWAYGTVHFKRCVPAITRFVREFWFEALIEEGVRRVEARSLVNHDIAHRWLASLGAKREGLLRGFGVNGEDFELWAFVYEDFAHVLQSNSRHSERA